MDNPTGGESYYPGFNIRYPLGCCPDIIVFQRILHTGGSYTEIASEVTNDYFNWTVTNVPSTDCFYQIYYYNNNCVMDSTTTKFTILPGIPQCPAPTEDRNIMSVLLIILPGLNKYYYTDFVTIQYSTNNGSSWLPIANAVSNSGTYSGLFRYIISAMPC